MRAPLIASLTTARETMVPPARSYKVAARDGAVNERDRAGGLCLSTSRQEDRGAWGLVPENLRRLIVGMVQDNPTWGEERVAAELSVKLGILV